MSYKRLSIFHSVFLSLVGMIPALASDAPARWTAPHFSTDAKVLYEEASEQSALEGTDVTVLDDEESYAFDALGRNLYTAYMVYKISTQRGSEGWSSISVVWEPWHQERPKIRVRVITPDFVVHDLDLKTLTDAPAQDEESNIYSDRRVIRGPLPAVAPGSLVEQEVVVNENTPFFGAGTIGRYFFGRVSVPVRHSRLTVEAPSSVPLHYIIQLLPDLQPQRLESAGRARLVFERGPIDPLEKAESNLPSDVPAYASVTFSTGASWEQVAGEYAAIVENHVTALDVKPLVEKLTQSKHARNEKAQAILEYVDKEIRYTGVEFGDATIVPHSPNETLTRKYGDCKDKSALLVTMLRAAGIPAYIALLNAGGRLDVPADLAGMGLFDHAIVYAPGTPDLWIDATDEYARLGQLPISDQGRLALVVRAGTRGLVRTPEGPSQDNVLLELRQVYLGEYGPARVIEKAQPHGTSESSYRRSYGDKQSKTAKEELTSYVKAQYLAEKLDRLDRSDPGDLSHQFELVLESDRAKRGFTDLEIAVAAIRLEGLFSRLPSELRQREKQDDNSAGGQRSKRTADYQLPEAFATEWRYTIAPPAGFQPKPLPKSDDLHLGPCVLTEEFAADRDNTVHATLRFDTVKRRLTVAEARELRDKIVRLVESQPVLIYFEPVGQALANEGRTRDALQSYRDVIALHPKEAVHHLRMAKRLLAAGLGEAARQEAQTAVRLEPSSALAERTLAEILEYDLVGRKFRAGSDYGGAEAAFRAAEKLDPDDKAIVANLAILLEYNRSGLRYGPGARLKDAVVEYRKLSPEKLSDLGVENNLAYALFYDGDFAEAEKYAEALNPQATALIVACEAAINGSQKALTEAKRRTESEERFKQVAAAAGQMLINFRKYPLGADLEDAGASGDSASDTAAYAALYRKTVPHEQLQLNDDPVGVALRLEILTSDPNLGLDQLGSIASRNGAKAFAIPPVLSNLVKEAKATLSNKAKKGDFADVGLDLSITRAQPKVQGDDAIGYKVTLWPSTNYKSVRYIVKEAGKYKVLGYYRFEGLGLEILDRIAANDLTGARALLDWLREDWNLAASDDPLAGTAFPRMWTKGRGGDVAFMKVAAAAITAYHYKTAATGIPILEAALTSASSDADKLNIMIALAEAYDLLENYEKALSLRTQLAKQFPESKSLFFDQEFDLRTLGRFDDADKLCEDRLQRLPGDSDAMHALAYNAIRREHYAQGRSLYRRLVDDGKAEPSDLNNIAWYALFVGRVEASDIEDALKAAQLSDKKPNSLHTLGCVYAGSGKTKEARDVLLEAMDADNLDEPDSSYLLAFGLIAEQYGERDLAFAYYTRVTKPEKPYQIPGSSYRLAQIRIQVLQDKM